MSGRATQPSRVSETSVFIHSVFRATGLSKMTLFTRQKYLISLGLTKDNYERVLSDTSIARSDNINTWITRVFHVISFLKLVKSTQLLAKYTSIAEDLKPKSMAIRNDNRKRDKFIDRETLMSKLREQSPLIPYTNADLRDNRGAWITRYQDVEHWVLTAMYVLSPPARNDYGMVRIVKRKADLDEHHNSILISPRSIYVYLTQFKTVHSFGTMRLTLNPEVSSAVRYMIRLRKALKLNSNVLFNSVSPAGMRVSDESPDLTIRPISKENILYHIRIASMKYFGSEQSINDYRHSYETWLQASDAYQKMTTEERAKEHEKLLHHHQTGVMYNRV